MIACDTNILFPALEASHSRHAEAREYLESQATNPDFALCELVLVEVYTLLRNPVTSAKSLSAADAARKILNLRQNPAWLVLDYPGGLMNEVWDHARTSGAVRRIYDIRLALTLRFYGVTEFATSNAKHFHGFGFNKVWDPLAATRGKEKTTE